MGNDGILPAKAIGSHTITSWHSYPSIYNLGHRVLEKLFEGPVVIEEKVDGSQFSFGLINGELKVRSKGKEMDINAPEKMFNQAVATVKQLHEEEHLIPGYTYRGEYLQKPKHNVLTYSRIPNRHIALYDINIGHEHYMCREEKQSVAANMGLEVVPQYQWNGVLDQGFIDWILSQESFLGGCKIEGFVVKNYNQFGPDKKVLMGKYVSPAFKEIHGKEWKRMNPLQGDILAQLGERYCAEGRWRKAIQHVRDLGKLEQSPKDIGALVKEIPADVKKECEEEIKELLFKWAWPHIARASVRGFPEWYRQVLQWEEGSDYPDGSDSEGFPGGDARMGSVDKF